MSERGTQGEVCVRERGGTCYARGEDICRKGGGVGLGLGVGVEVGVVGRYASARHGSPISQFHSLLLFLALLSQVSELSLKVTGDMCNQTYPPLAVHTQHTPPLKQDDVVAAAEEWLFGGGGRRSVSVMIFGGPGAGGGGQGHAATLEPFVKGSCEGG